MCSSQHQRLLRRAFGEFGGQEIDTQGDAFFVAFRRARDAALAAIAAQRTLGAHNWPAGVELRVRMGIHTGEPAQTEERYHGLGVHRAARIMAAGHGGQILVSQATCSVLGDDELPETELRDLGEHRLKDLDRPERIFQLVAEGLPDDFRPLRTEEAPTAYSGLEDGLAEAAQVAVTRSRIRRPRTTDRGRGSSRGRRHRLGSRPRVALREREGARACGCERGRTDQSKPCPPKTRQGRESSEGLEASPFFPYDVNAGSNPSGVPGIGIPWTIRFHSTLGFWKFTKRHRVRPDARR